MKFMLLGVLGRCRDGFESVHHGWVFNERMSHAVSGGHDVGLRRRMEPPESPA